MSYAVGTVLFLHLALPAPGGAAPSGAAAMAPAGMPEAKPMGTGWKHHDYSQAKKLKDERIPSSTLVIIAYVLIWGVLLAYVVFLAVRQIRLRREIEQLQGMLARTATAPAETEGEE